MVAGFFVAALPGISGIIWFAATRGSDSGQTQAPSPPAEEEAKVTWTGTAAMTLACPSVDGARSSASDCVGPMRLVRNSFATHPGVWGWGDKLVYWLDPGVGVTSGEQTEVFSTECEVARVIPLASGKGAWILCGQGEQLRSVSFLAPHDTDHSIVLAQAGPKAIKYLGQSRDGTIATFRRSGRTHACVGPVASRGASCFEIARDGSDWFPLGPAARNQDYRLNAAGCGSRFWLWRQEPSSRIARWAIGVSGDLTAELEADLAGNLTAAAAASDCSSALAVVQTGEGKRRVHLVDGAGMSAPLRLSFMPKNAMEAKSGYWVTSGAGETARIFSKDDIKESERPLAEWGHFVDGTEIAHEDDLAHVFSDALVVHSLGHDKLERKAVGRGLFDVDSARTVVWPATQPDDGFTRSVGRCSLHVPPRAASLPGSYAYDHWLLFRSGDKTIYDDFTKSDSSLELPARAFGANDEFFAMREDLGLLGRANESGRRIDATFWVRKKPALTATWRDSTLRIEGYLPPGHLLSAKARGASAQAGREGHVALIAELDRAIAEFRVESPMGAGSALMKGTLVVEPPRTPVPTTAIAPVTAHRGWWPLAVGLASTALLVGLWQKFRPRFRVFISYARADREVSEFVSALKSRCGSSYRFFNDVDIPPGQHWQTVLADKLRTADAMLCFYSPAFFASRWCGSEFAYFFARATRRSGDGRETRVVPVHWVTCTPHGDAAVPNWALIAELRDNGLQDLHRGAEKGPSWKETVFAASKTLARLRALGQLPRDTSSENPFAGAGWAAAPDRFDRDERSTVAVTTASASAMEPSSSPPA